MIQRVKEEMIHSKQTLENEYSSSLKEKRKRKDFRN